MSTISTFVVYAVIVLGAFVVLVTILAFLLVRRMAQAVKERELHSKQIRETVIQTQELDTILYTLIQQVIKILQVVEMHYIIIQQALIILQ